MSHIKRIINHLETLLDGCFLLGELSPRTSDTILSFGELLSSYIIAEALKQQHKNSGYKDSRELIKTNNNYGKAAVNFEVTNELIADYFASNEAQIVIVPGFIASTNDGIGTTLGRGGSDYTAAIIAYCPGCHRIGNLDRRKRNVHRQSKNRETSPTHCQHFLSRSDGIVAFRCQSVVSANDSTRFEKKHSDSHQKHFRTRIRRNIDFGQSDIQLQSGKRYQPYREHHL